MGFVGFLNFGLKCFHLLAWPLFALAYPLYASIRAIETNSSHQMRKLVAYWILFALVSLFELAFVNLIEWVPLWSYIKLGAVCWLVLPRFRRAHCCYRSFVHPCLSVNLDLQRRLSKLQDDSLEEKNFLSVAEGHVIENGTDALMKLIASKDSMTQFGEEEMKVVAEAVKKEMRSTVTSNLNEFNTSQKYTNRREVPEKNAFAAAKLVKSADAYLVRTEKKNIAAVKVKEATVPAAVAEKKLWKHLRKVQKEWTCAVCQVKTCTEADLNSHLGGRKHKDKCEELKLKVRATKQTAKYKAVSSSPVSKGTQTNQDSKKPVSGDGLREDKFRKQAEKVQVNVISEPCKQNTSSGSNSGSVSLKSWCPYCEVTCYKERDFLSHLKGKKHLARVQERVQGLAGYTAGVQGWNYAGYRADAQGWDNTGFTTGAQGWDYTGDSTGGQGWDYSGLAYGWR